MLFLLFWCMLCTATPDISSSSKNINSTTRVSRISFCFLWLWFDPTFFWLILNSRRKTSNYYTKFSDLVSFWSNMVIWHEGIWSKSDNVGKLIYFRIPHPEISLDEYFHFYSSTITLIDTEFDHGIWSKSENVGKLTYFWVTHPEISLDKYFHFILHW